MVGFKRLQTYRRTEEVQMNAYGVMHGLFDGLTNPFYIPFWGMCSETKQLNEAISNSLSIIDSIKETSQPRNNDSEGKWTILLQKVSPVLRLLK